MQFIIKKQVMMMNWITVIMSGLMLLSGMTHAAETVLPAANSSWYQAPIPDAPIRRREAGLVEEESGNVSRGVARVSLEVWRVG